MRHDDGYIPFQMRRSNADRVVAQSVNDDWLDSSVIGIAEAEEPAQARRCPLGSKTYALQAGDTLLALARTHNTTVQEILAMNPQLDQANFGPGDVICIPGAGGLPPTPPPAPEPCPAGSRTHVVQQGDTMESIAAQYNTTVAQLQDINRTINPYDLPVGQTICIPAATTPTPTPTPTPNCPLGSKTYQVRSGDTIASIARANNTTAAAIVAMNPNINARDLVVGSFICIPGAGGLPPVPVPNCPLGSKTYQIRSGDTIAGLARTYNTTVSAIIAMNPSINVRDLAVGSYICIPGAGGLPPTPTPTPTPAPNCPLGSLTYTIRSGDTLRNIASRYNTTVADIIAMNPSLNPYYYTAGQVICIPGAGGVQPTPTCPAGSSLYTIVSGDTLSRIATRYGTTVDMLMRYNPTLNPNQLTPGQVICLPPASNALCPEGYTPYTIKAGDTLSSILITANISYGALSASNPTTDLSKLAVGQRLCLPAPGSRAGCVDTRGIYITQTGDTLTSIATAFAVPASEIMRVNPVMTPSDFAVAGRLVCIPVNE